MRLRRVARSALETWSSSAGPPEASGVQRIERLLEPQKERLGRRVSGELVAHDLAGDLGTSASCGLMAPPERPPDVAEPAAYLLPSGERGSGGTQADPAGLASFRRVRILRGR